ncbi:Outer membrane receptor for monomeric catechols [Raoultella terrigena]|uniref:Outer membrane receptor for monomeric catechols n=1 Tax=Raoultella terrigena TaxID=577 RepID=A0A3P8M3M9_RAOTE|nr:Outer membrane receptor for monomeric catechols [Raoultella terrigena]
MRGTSTLPPAVVLKRRTINELSYRSGNQGGLNFGLQPSTNETFEIGSKTRIGNGLFTAALFQTNTDNEIVVGRQQRRTHQL